MGFVNCIIDFLIVFALLKATLEKRQMEIVVSADEENSDDHDQYMVDFERQLLLQPGLWYS